MIVERLHRLERLIQQHMAPIQLVRQLLHLGQLLRVLREPLLLISGGANHFRDFRIRLADFLRQLVLLGRNQIRTSRQVHLILDAQFVQRCWVQTFQDFRVSRGWQIQSRPHDRQKHGNGLQSQNIRIFVQIRTCGCWLDNHNTVCRLFGLFLLYLALGLDNLFVSQLGRICNCTMKNCLQRKNYYRRSVDSLCN
jgi:hypothetical protein